METSNNESIYLIRHSPLLDRIDMECISPLYGASLHYSTFGDGRFLGKSYSQEWHSQENPNECIEKEITRHIESGYIVSDKKTWDLWRSLVMALPGTASLIKEVSIATT